MYDNGDKKNKAKARGQLIDIVSAAGDVGLKTLVRALATNEQEDLAKQLDEELAEQFIKKLPSVAGALSPSLPMLIIILLLVDCIQHYIGRDTKIIHGGLCYLPLGSVYRVMLMQTLLHWSFFVFLFP